MSGSISGGGGSASSSASSNSSSNSSIVKTINISGGINLCAILWRSLGEMGWGLVTL